MIRLRIWRRPEIERPAVAVEGVVNDLRRRLRCPGYGGQRREVRLQEHVSVGRVVLKRVVFLGILAGDGRGEDRRRHRHDGGGEELVGWHQLAAGDAGQIRRDALDIFDAPLLEPHLGLGEGFNAPLRVAFADPRRVLGLGRNQTHDRFLSLLAREGGSLFHPARPNARLCVSENADPLFVMTFSRWRNRILDAAGAGSGDKMPRARK